MGEQQSSAVRSLQMVVLSLFGKVTVKMALGGGSMPVVSMRLEKRKAMKYWSISQQPEASATPALP
ncbi:MAG: hypothetical protein HC772_04965 [Leptolyngbyaceae cyanobacterium CRU_2_3]|nr:hypothetical protein [Leptolyngbyaceae cyanobacterium CRU_2_3]